MVASKYLERVHTMSLFNILGHKRQIDILDRAYGLKRLAHSYIFAGPSGVGKKLLAKEFAKALNCEKTLSNEDAKHFTVCGNCPSCTSIEEGTHINFISLEPEKGIIKIDKVRELLKSLSYKVDKGMRVVVFDDGHTLGAEAQNALLKTLEEPPENTILILVTSRPQDFLTTILSRCQKIAFGVLEESLIKNYLIDEDGLAPDKAETIARLSGGSFSSAFAILDEGLDKKLEDFLSKFLNLMDCGSGSVEEVIKESGVLAKDEKLDDFFEVLKSWYRDIALINVGGSEFVHNKDFIKELESDRAFGFSKGAKAFSMVEESLYNLTPPRYGNKQLTLEVLLISLSGAMSSARLAR